MRKIIRKIGDKKKHFFCHGFKASSRFLHSAITRYIVALSFPTLVFLMGLSFKSDYLSRATIFQGRLHFARVRYVELVVNETGKKCHLYLIGCILRTKNVFGFKILNSFL